MKVAKIGVMGAKGSFSEEAGRTYVKKYAKLKKFEILYLIAAENVLSEIERGYKHRYFPD